MKIFIDSDVILDLLLQREPFAVHSVHLFNLLAHTQDAELKTFTTPIVFANLNLRKQFGNTGSRQKLIQLRQLIDIMPINEKIVDLALQSNLKDFEDILQIKTAEQFDIDIIVTRNIKDYKDSKKPVKTTLKFLQFFNQPNQKTTP